MRNDLYFDENDFIERVKVALKEAFSIDNEGNKTDYYYNMFGKKKIKVIDNLYEEIKSFPSLVITIDDNSNYSLTSDSRNIANHTQFLLRINIYTKSNDNYDFRYLATEISQRVKQYLQMKLGLECSSDNPTPYLDREVYRKTLSFIGTINNKTKVIFRT